MEALMKPGRVLVIVRDPELRNEIARRLDASDCACVAFASCEMARPLLGCSDSYFDLILLELAAGDPEGQGFMQAARQLADEVAVLVLVDVDDPTARIESLELGADDCMTKPVAVDEVVARVHAIMRRSMRLPVLRIGSLVMDLGKRVVDHHGCRVHLSPKEFDVLRLLIQAKGEVVERAVLLSEVWGVGPPPESNIIEMLITRLRRKLLRFADLKIVTEIGRGYRLEAGAADRRVT